MAWIFAKFYKVLTYNVSGIVHEFVRAEMFIYML